MSERDSSFSSIERTVLVSAQSVWDALDVEVVTTLLDSAHIQIEPVLFEESPFVKPREADCILLLNQILWDVISFDLLKHSWISWTPSRSGTDAIAWSWSRRF